MSLAAYYRGEMTLRQLRLVARGLPQDSRWKTIIRRQAREAGLVKPTPIEEMDPEVWSDEAWLMANLIDEVRLQSWMFSSVHRKEGASAPAQPDPLPRPGDPPRRQRKVNAWFGAMGLPGLPSSADELRRQIAEKQARTHRGRCSECSRLLGLLADGTVRQHGPRAHPCAGSRRPPDLDTA